MVSCLSTTTETIKYSPYKRSFKYTMELPKGRCKEVYLNGGSDHEQRYYYSDSSFIFITNSPTTCNQNYIEESSDYLKYFNAFLNNDTITIKGKSKSGLYWQDKRIGERGIIIGYSGANKSELLKYEKAINSFKRKR